jgi:hypothetical protein
MACGLEVKHRVLGGGGGHDRDFALLPEMAPPGPLLLWPSIAAELQTPFEY